MFNITTREGKQRYQQEMIKRMIAIERMFQKEIKPIIGRQYLNAARFVESGITDIDYAVTFESPRLKKTIEKQYRRCGTVFSKVIFDGLEETQKGIVQAPFVKGMKEDFWASMLGWIKRYGAKKVVQINETTRNAIKNIIARGKEDGKSYAKIAKDLRVIKDVASPIRAKRIARTEVHSASTKGLHSAVGSTGLKTEKEWLSFIDERIRGIKPKDQFNHIIANGERVKYEEKFIATGEPLDHPGDPEGSAGNIINCRCIQLYHAIRSYLQKPLPPEPVEEEVLEGWQDTKDLVKAKGQFLDTTKYEKLDLTTLKDKDSIEILNYLGKDMSDVMISFPKLNEIISKDPVGKSITIHNKSYIKKTKRGRTLALQRYITNLNTGKSHSELFIPGKIPKEEVLELGKHHLITKDISLSATFRHEYGHYIFDAYVNYTKAEEWSRVYKNNLWKDNIRTSFWRDNVSVYSESNHKEAFAESFSAYTSPLYGKKGQRLPKQIEDYFIKLIGKRKK